MKRRYFILMILILILSGCGADNTTKEVSQDVANSEVEESVNEIDNADEMAVDEMEEEAADEALVGIEALITEKDDSELKLKQYPYSYEDRNVEKEGDTVFDIGLFEEGGAQYKTTGNVELYAINGVHIGHTKENVSIVPIGVYDGWCYFHLEQNMRFARLADIETNAVDVNKAKEEGVVAEQQKEELPANDAKAVKTDVPIEADPVIENTPADTTTTSSEKYTPEEAVEVYRSLMEAGGIVWDPSLKNGGSWGTGFMYLNKGYPEWCASSSLESFAMGDTAGNPWTKYYLEITGSDELTVYVTEWHN